MSEKGTQVSTLAGLWMSSSEEMNSVGIGRKKVRLRGYEVEWKEKRNRRTKGVGPEGTTTDDFDGGGVQVSVYKSFVMINIGADLWLAFYLEIMPTLPI